MLSLRMVPLLIASLCVFFWILTPCASADPRFTRLAREIVADFTQRVRPLEITANRAWWQANITGKKEAFKAKEDAQNQLDAVLADRAQFDAIEAIRRTGLIDDPITKRAIDVIYLATLEKQVDAKLLKEMTRLSNDIEEKFTNFRARVDDKTLSDAEVRNILKTSTLSDRRQAAWEASKELGKVVEPGLRKLVKLRNQAAAGKFRNYHQMQLFLNEQDGDDLIKLFDRLDELTREPFKKAKAEIDVELAKACNVKVSELMPWHYHDPFFQEVPAVFKADLDKIYAKQDLIALCREFYRGIDLPIDLVIEKSGNDFAPRKGKNPHAFCTDITRDGTDVRVLANVVPGDYWMSTMLHEFGHSVYSSINIPSKLPYVLRSESNILTTEGVAMMFEKMSKRRAWLEKMGVKVEDPKAFDQAGAKMLRYQLLIFSRWCQVMLRFEKGMYENPDQDLNKLWWDLVERYQMIRRPPGRNAPDYASKYHIVGAPVYYHNYMMGELFASQLHHAIARKVYKGANPNTVVYVGNKAVGAFMRQYVFDPGRTLSWNALTRHATGADLSPEAFAKDFSGKK
ncbi:MAG: M2 family metallopeptidase [Planctomycetes bacterium]|nr:M2 family metallopeptidase [Planctomycetota bacterium]